MQLKACGWLRDVLYLLAATAFVLTIVWMVSQ
jgi:hypothetical protein